MAKVSQHPFSLIIFLSFNLVYYRLPHDQKLGALVPSMVPLEDREAFKRWSLVGAIKSLGMCPQRESRDSSFSLPCTCHKETNFVS